MLNAIHGLAPFKRTARYVPRKSLLIGYQQHLVIAVPLDWLPAVHVVDSSQHGYNNNYIQDSPGLPLLFFPLIICFVFPTFLPLFAYRSLFFVTCAGPSTEVNCLNSCSSTSPLTLLPRHAVFIQEMAD